LSNFNKNRTIKAFITIVIQCVEVRVHITRKQILEELNSEQRTWLVTGCAGFIGSNLIEFLLENNQIVKGLDNFSTGFKENLEDVKQIVGSKWENFQFTEGDITNLEDCLKVMEGVDIVLHQAALGSVPRSIEHPANSHDSNVNGQFNVLLAAKEKSVKKVVYASSSSVYGDEPTLPKVEDRIGEQLSPYAVTKHVNELYGKVFYKSYELPTIGIRYFNVFGKRQNPNGAYAAVIPKWIGALSQNEEIKIYGDGETSRDFSYIDNVVEMNVVAGLTKNEEAFGQVFNCSLNSKTSLTELFQIIKTNVQKYKPELSDVEPIYTDFRKGDIKHSQADISKIIKHFNYRPSFAVAEGLEKTVESFFKN